MSKKPSVTEFLGNLDPKKKKDCKAIMAIMRAATGKPAKMWGNQVGFGSYHYKYESGHEGDSFLVGFAPSKQRITLYIMPGFSEFQDELKKLGKHKTGKCCLYLNSLENVDLKSLNKIVTESVKMMKKKYGS